MSLSMLTLAADAVQAMAHSRVATAVMRGESILSAWELPPDHDLHVYFLIVPAVRLARQPGATPGLCLHDVHVWLLTERGHDEHAADRLSDDLMAKEMIQHGYCWS